MLFTVEYHKDGIVEIYCDKEGLSLLITRLMRLQKDGKGHEHFMTPSWAGNELTEEKQYPENELINHLCIMLKPG